MTASACAVGTVAMAALPWSLAPLAVHAAHRAEGMFVQVLHLEEAEVVYGVMTRPWPDTVGRVFQAHTTWLSCLGPRGAWGVRLPPIQHALQGDDYKVLRGDVALRCALSDCLPKARVLCWLARSIHALEEQVDVLYGALTTSPRLK